MKNDTAVAHGARPSFGFARFSLGDLGFVCGAVPSFLLLTRILPSTWSTVRLSSHPPMSVWVTSSLGLLRYELHGFSEVGVHLSLVSQPRGEPLCPSCSPRGCFACRHFPSHCGGGGGSGGHRCLFRGRPKAPLHCFHPHVGGDIIPRCTSCKGLDASPEDSAGGRRGRVLGTGSSLCLLSICRLSTAYICWLPSLCDKSYRAFSLKLVEGTHRTVFGMLLSAPSCV